MVSSKLPFGKGCIDLIKRQVEATKKNVKKCAEMNQSEGNKEKDKRLRINTVAHIHTSYAFETVDLFLDSSFFSLSSFIEFTDRILTAAAKHTTCNKRL